MDMDALAARYGPARAKHYESERTTSRTWQAEQEVFGMLLAGLEPGSTVLDVPVGTGRFLPLYAAGGLEVTGVDSSSEMLAVAERRAGEVTCPARLLQGDIRAIEAPDNSFDAVVCVRFMNWIDAGAMREVFAELVRVARSAIIFGAWHYPPARELSPGRLLRQCKRRLYMWRTRADFCYHERRDIDGMLARHGLDAERRLIRSRADGVDYCGYRAGV